MGKLSRVFLEDIASIVHQFGSGWDALRSSTILITGSTGLIGYVLTHAISYASSLLKLNIHIIATGRSVAVGEVLSALEGVSFVNHDIKREFVIETHIDYIIHGASITQSAEMVHNPVDVIDVALMGTRNMLALARDKGVKRMVYLSSMEVYGSANGVIAEDILGDIDILTPRASYPLSKRMCECMCVAFQKQYGVNIGIARLARALSPGNPSMLTDQRIASQFTRCVVENKDIVLHTTGESILNFCYIVDVITGILMIMLKGANGQAYNVVNSDAAMSVYHMAEIMANKVAGGKISVRIDISKDISSKGYAAPSSYVLSAEKLSKLGWRPSVKVFDMFRRLVDDMMEHNNE